MERHGRARRSARGFTITEMLAVLTMATVLALMAGASFRRSHVGQDVDGLAYAIRGAVAQARGRAVATGTPYMIDVRPGSVRYCQVDPATISAGPPAMTTQARCPDSATGLELSQPTFAGTDAEIALVSAAAEVRQAAGVLCSAPARTALGAGAVVFVGPGGTADRQLSRVLGSGLPLGGATVYVRRVGVDEPDKRRRVVIYGPSAQPRIIAGY